MYNIFNISVYQTATAASINYPIFLYNYYNLLLQIRVRISIIVIIIIIIIIIIVIIIITIILIINQNAAVFPHNSQYIFVSRGETKFQVFDILCKGNKNYSTA